jgi:hypothetical protein
MENRYGFSNKSWWLVGGEVGGLVQCLRVLNARLVALFASFSSPFRRKSQQCPNYLCGQSTKASIQQAGKEVRKHLSARKLSKQPF